MSGIIAVTAGYNIVKPRTLCLTDVQFKQKLKHQGKRDAGSRGEGGEGQGEGESGRQERKQNKTEQNRNKFFHDNITQQ